MKNKLKLKAWVSMLLAIVVAVGATLPTFADGSSFTDVPQSAWYYEPVTYCKDNNLFKGTSDTTFSPDDDMTRSMFVTVLGRYEGIDENQYKAATTFSDVVASEWYGPYVKWASDNKIVKGYDTHTFGTDDKISREQMVTMFYRYAAFKGYNLAVDGQPAKNFSDYPTASSFAREALNWAVSRKLIRGTTSGLDPLGNSLRAQVAQVFYNIRNADIMSTTAPQTVYEDTQLVMRQEVSSEVPSYLVDNTLRVINAVNADASQAGTDTFLFFTDPHTPDNTWSSAKVMGSVFKHTGVKKVICGGDIPTGWETNKEDCTAAFTENYWPTISAILPPDARHYMVHGNHDYFYTDTRNGYTYLPATTNHYYVMQAGPNQESYVNSVPDKNYYTFRNDTAKVEYIVLDTVAGKGAYRIEGGEIDWLIDQLASVPAGYSTLVIGHIPVNRNMWSHDSSSSTTNLGIVQDVLEAYANRKATTIHIWDHYGYDHNRAVDFSQSSSSLIGYIAGHEHADNYRKDNGVNYITVCSDVPHTDVWIGKLLDRSVGTKNECAVDACVINTQNRTMTLYRIGAGEDLSISY